MRSMGIHPDDCTRSGAAAEALLLKPAIAAERLSLGRSKLYELIRDGSIESVVIGRSRRIPVGALEAYVVSLRAGRGE